MSRVIGIGGSAALVLAGVVLAVAGVHVVAFAVAALGLVGLTSWAFYEIGLSEDRDRAREAPEWLRAISRGHLDTRADAEPPELHEKAAVAALRAGAPVEFGGVAPAPLVAAAPVLRAGRPVGALAVSAHRTTRGRLTFAERRTLGVIAASAAALPGLGRPRRVGPPRR